MSAESGIRTFRDSNGLWEEYDISEALRIASKAASIAVSREGAVASIPTIQEVMKTLKQ